MKKKALIYLSMVALLVVCTIMTGCSSDDHIDNQQQTEINDNVVTLTATISFDNNAGTRAITSSGVKTFEATNKIAVIYKNTSNETIKAESGALTLSDDGTKATFTVTLSNPVNNGAIRYIYPSTMAKDVANDATITDDEATIDYTGLLSSQNGDLTTLGKNYDLAVYDGNLNGTNLPGTATLTNPLAICAFTLTNGGSNITNTVNTLTVSDGTNSYTITPSALSTIYVAMKPTSGNIDLVAKTASETYIKTATGKTLDANKLYSISVSMQSLVLATPLTIEVLTKGTIVVNNPMDGMQYSLDGGVTKTAVPNDGTPINGDDLNVGDKVTFYGTATSYNNTWIYGGTAQIKVYGNIMSLLYEDFADKTELPAGSSYNFYSFFISNTNLIDASDLLLPAKVLKFACYEQMFKDCTNLTKAPKELPATSLGQKCYKSMFDGCTNLTTAPKELPATTLYDDCYQYMFQKCTNLTTAPKLPATTLNDRCYYGMFAGCKKLTNAYVKAAYITDNPYWECGSMFNKSTATGAVLHTTPANKASWEAVMGSGKKWENWTVIDDWTD